MATTPEVLLAEGLVAQGIECDQIVQDQLMAFVHLLLKWNKVYNLTAVRDPGQIIVRHILDSLAVLPYLQGKRILDVGAGAGLPGIPLALLSPDRTFTECDSVAKKTRFMQQAVTELGLKNVEVVHSRVEDMQGLQPFDTVISRAFAPLADIIAMAGPLCARNGSENTGCLLAMKGILPEHELSGVPSDYTVQDIRKLTVYNLDEQRNLITILPRETQAG